MNDRDRFKLIGGPYRVPRCRVGRLLRCAMRGKVRVRGIREAPIQWPYKLRTGGGRSILILCGDLARAVWVESETAICYWRGAMGSIRFLAAPASLHRRPAEFPQPLATLLPGGGVEDADGGPFIHFETGKRLFR